MVYASCNVTYGRGIAIVTTTGEENEVGKIATMIQQVSVKIHRFKINWIKLEEQ